MLQHISDESFFNMALDALSNGLTYAKNLKTNKPSKVRSRFSSYMHPESTPIIEGVGSHGGTPIPRSSAQVAAGRMRKAFSRRPIPAKQEEGL